MTNTWYVAQNTSKQVSNLHLNWPWSHLPLTSPAPASLHVVLIHFMNHDPVLRWWDALSHHHDHRCHAMNSPAVSSSKQVSNLHLNWPWSHLLPLTSPAPASLHVHVVLIHFMHHDPVLRWWDSLSHHHDHRSHAMNSSAMSSSKQVSNLYLRWPWPYLPQPSLAQSKHGNHLLHASWPCPQIHQAIIKEAMQKPQALSSSKQVSNLLLRWPWPHLPQPSLAQPSLHMVIIHSMHLDLVLRIGTTPQDAPSHHRSHTVKLWNPLHIWYSSSPTLCLMSWGEDITPTTHTHLPRMVI